MLKLLDHIYIYLIPLALSAAVSLRSFRLTALKSYRLISVFLIITLAVEIFAITWKLCLYKTSYWCFSQSNLFIYCAFLSVRLVFLLLIYYPVLQSPVVRQIIRYSSGPLLCFFVINYFFIQTPNQVNTYSIIILHLVAIMLALVFFYQVLKDKNIIRLSAHPMIWISLGTLIYHAGTLPFFLFLNYLNKEYVALAYAFLDINQGLNIIMYSLYLIAFLCKPHF
ncbi:MAG: hypothetical protein JWQ57_4483 [Mucilaginibacter sp.]|nr:hypothetical protein [Mucilaginibacter sp.]